MMPEEDYSKHPHMVLLRTAYSDFRCGNPQDALDRIEPILLTDSTTQAPSIATGLLWGLAGDCYFKLSKYENGFIAYRKAMELDPTCGCLAVFAREVARHRRLEDAEFALQCLEVDREARRKAWREHFWHILRFSLNLDTLWFQLVIIPLTRRRLRRLATEFQSNEGFVRN
jgi:hypothetical protein